MEFTFDHRAVAALPPVLQRYVHLLYRRVWLAYAQAGCPLGPTDIGMLLWFEFRQYTTVN
ncbi:hypothetical protein [Rhodothermus bifroesti]|nr:hypothetical protein [Rhodothermus bifroesti]